MQAKANNYDPISFTCQLFMWGTQSPLLNGSSKSILNYLGKPVRCLTRGAFALGVVACAAPIGVIYHVWTGISLKFSSNPTDEEEHKELNEKVWKHLSAAYVDGKAFVLGTVGTPLAISLIAATILCVKDLQWLGAAAGGLSSLGISITNPVFGYMFALTPTTLAHLPENLANRIIGRRIFDKNETVSYTICEQVGRLQRLAPLVEEKSKNSNWLATIEIKTGWSTKLFEEYIAILGFLKSSEQSIPESFMNPHLDNLQRLLQTKYGDSLEETIKKRAEALTAF